MKFALLLKILEAAAAAADALTRIRRLYLEFKAEAQRANELTPEQSAELDAKAEVIFASEASQPSGR